MAFALLTGNLPFRRPETMATLFAHLNDPVPPLARYRSDLPPGTDAVLARGLAKEPRDRYGRCGEFAAALRDTLTSASRFAAPTRLESAPAAGPTVRREQVSPATAVSGPAAPAVPPPAGGRPVTRPAPPPPAAGQGGKLPLVSRSAIIAALAAAAAFGLLILLHGLG
jgi:serine/threonine-protein kinase